MELSRKASGGVGNHDVDTARGCRLNGIEYYRGGIAAILSDDGNVIALTPGHELLARRGAKRVAGSEHDAFSLGLKILRQFADCGCFTCPIDTRNHDYKWL